MQERKNQEPVVVIILEGLYICCFTLVYTMCGVTTVFTQMTKNECCICLKCNTYTYIACKSSCHSLKCVLHPTPLLPFCLVMLSRNRFNHWKAMPNCNSTIIVLLVLYNLICSK